MKKKYIFLTYCFVHSSKLEMRLYCCQGKKTLKNHKKNKVMKGLLKSALFTVLTARRIELHEIFKLNSQNEIKEKI